MADRDDFHRYRGDVIYDVWNMGGDPDRVDWDRCEDYYRDGLDEEAAARRELRMQRPRRHEEEEPRPEDY